MKRPLVWLGAVLTAVSVHAADEAVYSVPGMDAVRVQQNLTYTSGGATLAMDVYLPQGPAPATGWPVVIFVHGGPVQPDAKPKDWGIFRSYGRMMAASGMAAVTFNHRLTAMAQYPQAADDVAALIARVRGDAKALTIDPERVAVWGFSGGGPLLASVLAQHPAWLKCAASYYAFLDRPAAAPAEARLSALEVIGDGRPLPPLLIARAGKDDASLNASVDRFLALAIEKKTTIDLLLHPEGQHGFDIRDDVPRSREVIRRTVAFLQENLGVGAARSANAEDVRAAVTAVKQGIVDGHRRKDRAALDALYADDYAALSADGSVRTKAELLAGLPTDPVMVSGGYELTAVKSWGDTVVASGKGRFQYRNADGSTRNSEYASVNVFQKRNGRWVYVAAFFP